ncbi:hypothetical protein HGRIS_003758 [Hohenbuehelia grisea]|uniref:Uncharacterized protein n=1 Tax=Hohenbuehelia grisea TaxID=104357 RepID=A0ABR3JGF7_9AGAR
MFFAARTPSFIQYHTPTSLPKGLDKVPLPADFDSMDAEEQALALVDVDNANRHTLYEALCATENTGYYHALTGIPHELITQPIFFAGRTWSRGLVPLREFLIRLWRYWHVAVPGGGGVPCPIGFTDEELAVHRQEAVTWQRAEDHMEILNASLGVQENGWVHNDQYEDAVAKNDALRMQLLDTVPEGPEREEAAAVWPYRPWES